MSHRTTAKFRVVCGEGFLARKRMATHVLRSINNLEQKEIYSKFIIVMKSGAPLLGFTWLNLYIITVVQK